MQSVWTRRTAVAVVALVATVVVVRVVLVVAVTAADEHRADSDDKSSYVDPARALLHDGDFDKDAGSSVPEFFRTPGYPAFLATVWWVAGEGDTAVYVVQAVLSGLAVFLAIVLGRGLSGAWPVGLAAAVLVVVDPAQTVVQGVVGTEGLATLLVTLVACAGVAFARSGLAPRWGVAYGLAVAAATYVRPTTFYFAAVPVLLLAFVALHDPRRRRAAALGGLALVAPCVVLLGAWNVRNRAEVGSWRFSAVESVNLYWYRAADVIAERDGRGFQEVRVALTEDLHRELGGRGTPVDASDYASGQIPPAWEDRQGLYYGRAQRDGLEALRSEPLLLARQVADGVYSQVVQSGWVAAFAYLTGDDPPAPVRLAGLAVVWAVEALAVVGMIASLRRDPDDPGDPDDPAPGADPDVAPRLAHALTIGLLAYTILASAGPEAADGARFRVPVWPIWCVYAVLGALSLGAMSFRARRRPT
jgi:hypothetical protein